MAAELAGVIRAWDPDTAVIEKVHAMPAQGVSSSFRFGQALGVIEGVLGALTIATEYVTPQMWKKHYRLTRHKEDARLRALQLWPRITDQLSRKRDADRAEALLIANWKIEHESN